MSGIEVNVGTTETKGVSGKKLIDGSVALLTAVGEAPEPTYPSESVILSGDISITVAGTAYTSGDVSGYSSHMIEVDTIGGTSFDVYGSVDGTNFVGPLRLTDKKTGALFAASPLTAVGLFELEGKFVNVRVDLVGAGASVARILHGVK